MSINWQDLLTTVGGGTGILLAAAWLIKAVLTSKLAQDTEAFKARLKADADIETEKLRHSLQTLAVEHQVRFSKLHERRAEVIAELYSKIVDAEQDGLGFAYVGGFKEGPERQEAYLATHKRLVELYYFAEKNRIYLPEHICALMKTFMDAVRKSVIELNIYAPIDQPLNPQLLEKKVQVITEVYQAFEGKIPAARRELENEFRQVLGVEQLK